ncbi:MAG: hypothetical protein ACE5NG_14310 [bacterium]
MTLFGWIIVVVLLGPVIGSIIGIMVYLSGDEMLPASQKFHRPHLSNFGLAGGILFVLLLTIFR